MSATITTAEPTTFRLPKPGESDPIYGFSRSFYYELDKRFQVERGEKLLIHICAQGKKRGVTVVPNAKMAAYMREQMEQNAG